MKTLLTAIAACLALSVHGADGCSIELNTVEMPSRTIPESTKPRTTFLPNNKGTQHPPIGKVKLVPVVVNGKLLGTLPVTTFFLANKKLMEPTLPLTPPKIPADRRSFDLSAEIEKNQVLLHPPSNRLPPPVIGCPPLKVPVEPRYSPPKIVTGRCTPQARFKLLRWNGGTSEMDAGVGRALNWFAKNQNPDGSWGAEFKPAVTGLVLLTFLGQCETTRSSVHGNVVKKAIDFLVKTGKATGGPMWDHKPDVLPTPFEASGHGMAATALAEALILTQDQEIQPILESAIQTSLTAYLPNSGGWNAQFGKDAPIDMWVTGWQLHALIMGRLADVKKEQLDDTVPKAIASLKGLQGVQPLTPDAKNSTNNLDPLIGMGLFCARLQGHHLTTSKAQAAIDFILGTHTIDYAARSADFRQWYADTYGLFTSYRLGNQWEKWQPRIGEQILANQLPDGHWPPNGSQDPELGGGVPNKTSPTWDAYRTALCTLILEVYYRYLPRSD